MNEVKLRASLVFVVNTDYGQRVFDAARYWQGLSLDQVRAMGAAMPEVLERLTELAESEPKGEAG